MLQICVMSCDAKAKAYNFYQVTEEIKLQVWKYRILFGFHDPITLLYSKGVQLLTLPGQMRPKKLNRRPGSCINSCTTPKIFRVAIHF